MDRRQQLRQLFDRNDRQRAYAGKESLTASQMLGVARRLRYASLE